MSKVYVLYDENAYGGHQVIGVFSSKEKADLAVILKTRYDCFGGEGIKECEIDEVLLDFKNNLEQEVDEYKGCLDLLDKVNKIMST